MRMDYVAYQGFIDERMRREFTILKRNGWQIGVFLNYPRSYRAQVEGVETRVLIPSRIVSNSLFDLLFFWPLFIFLRYFPAFVRNRNQLRLLYVLNYPDSFAVPFLVLAKFFRVPTVYEIRDPWKEYFLTESQPDAIIRSRFRGTYSFMALIEKIAISLASGIVFVTPSFKEIHASESSEKPTCIINNYSNYQYSDQVAARAQELKTRFGLGNNIVGSYIAGNFQPYRGIDTLLEAVSISIKSNPKIRLLIVGGNAESLTLIRKKISEMHLEDSCTVTGWIAGEELIHYYLMSDFGILPHKSTPATQLIAPIKLFDYMVLGKPIIMTALREQLRYVTDELNGLVVKPDDANDLARAILELANDPVRLGEIAKKAAEEGKKYQFANLEQVFLQFISRISKSA